MPASCMPLMHLHGLVGTPLVEPEVRRAVGLLRRQGSSLPLAATRLAAAFRSAFAAAGPAAK